MVNQIFAINRLIKIFISAFTLVSLFEDSRGLPE